MKEKTMNYELEFHYKDDTQDPMYVSNNFPGMDKELYYLTFCKFLQNAGTAFVLV